MTAMPDIQWTDSIDSHPLNDGYIPNNVVELVQYFSRSTPVRMLPDPA